MAYDITIDIKHEAIPKYTGAILESWYNAGLRTAEAIAAHENAKKQSGKPSMIILDTIKGHGCELAENTFPCHHIAFKPEDIAPSIAKAEAVLDAARKA
jgi:transketolase